MLSNVELIEYNYEVYSTKCIKISTKHAWAYGYITSKFDFLLRDVSWICVDIEVNCQCSRRAQLEEVKVPQAPGDIQALNYW